MSERRQRSTAIILEDCDQCRGAEPKTPNQHGVIVALVNNRCAGTHSPERQLPVDDLNPLGFMMTDKLISVLGGLEAWDMTDEGGLR